MKCCERPLHCWFYKGVRYYDNPKALDPYEEEKTMSVQGTAKSQGLMSKKSAAKPVVSETQSIQSEHTSVYFEGIAMKFRENIRMLVCEKHGMNAIMASIRLDDFTLAEYLIKQVEESGDIDEENVYGDTALTLACRMGKLDFVRLLVQHGADLNKETFNGRTALIEAIKCPTENLPMIEYLVKEGCMVTYKTAKHRRTALDWARRYAASEISLYEEKRSFALKSAFGLGQVSELREFSEKEPEKQDIPEEDLPMELTEEQRRLMGRPKTVRILELASVVQQQCNIMFQKIAIGDTDYIISIIKDGDFFDPRNEEKAYEQMHKNVALADQSDEEIVKVQKRMHGLSDKVDRLQGLYKDCLDRLKAAEDFVEDLFSKEQSVDKTVNNSFSNYEKLAAKMTVVELEEIVRVKPPPRSLLVALFAFGIVFNLMPIVESARIDLDNILESKSTWLSIVQASVRNGPDALRLLQNFSRARLHYERHQGLFSACQTLLIVFKVLSSSSSEGLSLTMPSSPFPGSPLHASPAPYSLPSSPSSPNRPKSPSLADYIFLATRTDEGSDAGGAGARGDSKGGPGQLEGSEALGSVSPMKSSKREKIDDYEWDSDAEDPEGGGRWEKGEWVSVSRRRADWWNPLDNGEATSVKEKIRREKLVVLTTDVIETEKQKTLQEIEKKLSVSHLPSTVELMEEDKILNVVRPITAVAAEGSPSRARSRVQSKSSSPGKPGSVKGSRREKSRVKSKNKKSTRKSNESSGDELDNTGQPLVIGQTDDVGHHFVSCIISLLTAIVTFGSNYPALLERRLETRSAVVVVDGLKVDLDSALAAYNDQFNLRAGLEQEYIKQLKKSRFHHEKVSLYSNKVRVSRLFNYVCVNGHTAISYAASYGNYALVEEMLSRGGSVGYTAEALIEVVKFIQMSYRIYRMTLKAKASLKRADEDDAAPAVKQEEKIVEQIPDEQEDDNVKEAIDPLEAFTNSRARYLNLMREIELMKERRSKILSIVVFNRQKIRLPIPEALYMGHWEIAHRIYERRLWHAYFTHTYTFPLPHTPYLRQYEYMYSHDKRNVLDIMAHAINHVASGIYTPKEGWLPPGHIKEPFGEMIIEISKILEKLAEKNTKAKNAKHRFRIIQNSKKNMVQYEQRLMKLIYQRKFRDAVSLVTDRGLNVDLETTDGQTLLIAASDENVHALNHKYILNDELKPVLAVEYLLDRYSFRPNINYETKGGLTALLRACLLGREDIVVALLNRGANINYKNIHGMTVLHYSAYCGHSHIVRLLTERSIDLAAKDRQNRTAYQLAEEQNFIDIMMLLSQRATGNLGKLAYTRGDINNFFSCPLGCGARLMNYMMESHMTMECECRYVVCPNGCEDARIMKKEVEKHVVEQCVHRLIDCRDCKVAVACSDMRDHLYKECTWRIVPCLNEGCDKQMPFKDLDLHLRVCPQKLVPCPLMCNIFLPEICMENHVTSECLNRRVPCPLKCRNAIICKLLDDHMSNICSRRAVSCPLCDAQVEKQYLEKHVREECGNRDIPCPNDCKKLLPLSGITQHLLHDCSLRYVPCTLECGVNVQAMFLDSHLQSKCINRLIACKYGCLEDENVPADQQRVRRFTEKLIQLHEQYDCINRPLRCALCSAGLLSRQKLRHSLEQCGKRIMCCPHKSQGCMKELAHDKLVQHLALQCKYRDILCPLGCQRYLTSIKKLSHVQDECLYRYIPCPLGCKEQVKVKDVMGHISNDCVRRHVTHVCYTSKDKDKKKEKRQEAETRASAGDLNAMLTSMNVQEMGSDTNRESKKVKMRKEETLRVQKVRSELRMSAELRSKLIQAVQSSSGAKLVANNI
ncbi:hypothetical protein EON65_04755 [archaeon]|nr:MAG: hypothetical protein EON65_04755 [archaeon]